MKKSHLVSLMLLLFTAQIVFSQSNEILDQLLDEERASLGRASYLVFMASGIASEDWTIERSIQELHSRNWGLEEFGADTHVKTGVFALMIMKEFGMKGGIMYAIIPGPRYAAREFSYRGFVPGVASPGRILSGAEVTHILGSALDFLGEREVSE
ncbi:MAG: hypothetical protein HN368_10705 [Spirochaetales bacterium]|jgi:hypothetical protein|nr:hypothetical protein [Spirochaetales bacterium]